jgi:crotonobetainyl-CoA:carnitine CoA-transferase CaiB-like acyl-CoA transferase
MFEAAINVGAEPAIEWSANGVMVERMGNRSPAAAPQNLFATDEPERWLAVSCGTDEQWRALTRVIGHPELIDEPELATLSGRRAAAERLDALIGAWAATRSVDDAVDELLAVGVPAARGADARRASTNPQMQARNYFEVIDHPVVGTHLTPSLPFRYASLDRWVRRPAPTLGEHNIEILGGWLGHSADELAALEAEGVIGTWPAGA